MNRTLVIGAGPTGLLAAWIARRGGAEVRVLAAGIGSTHIMPGWLGSAQPEQPHALAGPKDFEGGLAALREVCAFAGIVYEGDSSAGLRLPTALGALMPVAYAPESFAAGDIGRNGAMLIAGPAGWRDFYPALCAANLVQQGVPATHATFDLPEMQQSKFDATAAGLARLLDGANVRERIARNLKPLLGGAARVGLPAIVGLERHREAWQHMQDLLGLPVFEIPTLPPSVPGMRLWAAFKAALARLGVQVLLEMPVTRGLVVDGRAVGAAVTGAARDTIFEADKIILATGGLYGGGIVADRRGQLCETVFGFPVAGPPHAGWFSEKLLPAAQPIHSAGIRANSQLQPVDDAGRVLVENVRVAGRLLASYNLGAESREGVWLATAHRAATI